jgi:hypothetical protein
MSTVLVTGMLLVVDIVTAAADPAIVDGIAGRYGFFAAVHPAVFCGFFFRNSSAGTPVPRGVVVLVQPFN